MSQTAHAEENNRLFFANKNDKNDVFMWKLFYICFNFSHYFFKIENSFFFIHKNENRLIDDIMFRFSSFLDA